MIVTIDGLAASGKSSVASGVARRLEVPYLSSGLLYRAATRVALARSLPLTESAPLLERLEREPLRLLPLPGGNQVWQGEQDLTPSLHTEEVDAQVSALAALPELRGWVNARLRALTPPFVAEGRDMGTVVFPGAEYKFFLTASPAVRAARRVRERAGDLGSVEQALRERDARDAHNTAPAPDARQVDTGSGTLETIIEQVLSFLPAPPPADPPRGEVRAGRE